MKDYHYFVSYVFGKNFQIGTGNCDVYVKTKILSCKDIKQIQEKIEKDSKLEGVTIINFKEF